MAFFSYPDKPSLLKAPGTQVHSLVERDEDSAAGLAMLIDALGIGAVAPLVQPAIETPVPSGALTPENIAHALAAALPEDCIVVDESLTTGRESMGLTIGAKPHDMINNMGGSIGYGTPVATGAAFACPDRRTFCMVGDGSAMYTIQSLWTQAREGAAGYHDHLRQQPVRNPEGRVHHDGRGRRTGSAGNGDARYRSADDRLGGDGEEHGRARRASG